MSNKIAYFGIRNPHQYMVEYISRHFGDIVLNQPRVYTQGNMTKGSIVVRQGGEVYIVVLMIPSTAPNGARPLCVKVVHQGRRAIVWEYREDHRPDVGWGKKERIHLAAFSSKLILVHVRERNPEEVVRVTNIFGSPFGLALGGLLKVHYARLWGMTHRLSKQEKAAIAEA